MKYCYITFRSVTYAQQGERVLRRNQVKAQLQRTPGWMEQRGCGYCLRLRPQDAAAAVAVLRENGVDFRRVYRSEANGSLEEMVL